MYITAILVLWCELSVYSPYEYVRGYERVFGSGIAAAVVGTVLGGGRRGGRSFVPCSLHVSALSEYVVEVVEGL